MAKKCPKCQSDNPETATFCADCGAKLLSSRNVSDTKTLEIPLQVLTRRTTFANRYEIIDELGAGGMGRVYRVFDKKIKEEVALKLLKPEIGSDRKTVERFANEIKLARKITHKNVCRMHDLNEEEGTLYITMEYVRGEDLKSLIQKTKQLTTAKAISISEQVCEGLSEAHRLGIVHRDLKPSNIMIDTEGNVRIMDFGIARSLWGREITGEGVIIGTPDYMSPEQAEGKEADSRSDIYSLGVILFEMVTGQVLFEGETPLSVVMKHKTEIPQQPKKLNPHLPDGLNRLILCCLEKEPEKRYQTTEELLADLVRIKEDLPSTDRIPSKHKTTASREITVKLTPKKLLIPALVLIIALSVTIMFWRPWIREDVVSIPIGKPSLAIMYFKNNTGDEKLDYWRIALSDLLIADLSQSKYIRVLSGASLFNILNQLNQLEAKNYSSEVLKEVGTRGKSNYVLVGDYTRAGDDFRINAMLQEAETSELVGSETVEGTGEQSFFTMMDHLTRKIKAHFQLSASEVAKDIDENITKITTNSPEAYKYFSKGTLSYRKADYRNCIESMEKAVGIDPEFAMAYRTMAYAYGTLGYAAERKKYLQKALDLKDRISERERFLIQGDFYRHSEETANLAIEAYTKLLELYPEEWIGNINLGILYKDLEQWDKAIEHFEINKQDQNAYYFSSLYLAQSYAATGRYDKAKEIFEYYLNHFSDNATVRWYLAQNYIYEGKYDLALIEAEKASSLNPDWYYNFLLKGDIYHLKGDWEKSEQEYSKLLESKEQAGQMYGRLGLAALYLSRGKFKDSISLINQACKIAKKLGDKSSEFNFLRYLASMHVKSGNPEEALKIIEGAWQIVVETQDLTQKKSYIYDKAAIYFEMGMIEESMKEAEELKKMVLGGINQKEIRYYHYLVGAQALEMKDFPKAVKYLKKALSIVPYQYASNNEHALFIDTLASVYFEAGDLEKARTEYERILSLTIARLYYGDIYAHSHYMLGKIFEQKGWEGKAIEHYEKFLDIWKDADPGIAEAEDARKRLIELKEE